MSFSGSMLTGYQNAKRLKTECSIKRVQGRRS